MFNKVSASNPALVTTQLNLKDIKIFSFNSVDEWEKFVIYNRAEEPAPLEFNPTDPEHGYDVIAGWISTGRSDAPKPLGYKRSQDHPPEFFWQYSLISEKAIAAANASKTVEFLDLS
ncbi:unnamed protein product [Cyclocybe aegerita]|uniref:Uncharacterized protein n=1 Tax=Cyclocybe aegerita TaxID=1973307 RepID=A0A8S0WHU0_CYCAE|nr:unnamed protein product [Cyclocybe aegerita]